MIYYRLAKFPMSRSSILFRCKSLKYLLFKRLYHHYNSRMILDRVPLTLRKDDYRNNCIREGLCSVASEIQKHEKVDTSSCHVENLLHSESEDSIMKQLEACVTPNEVFDIINSIENLQPGHAEQAVVTLNHIRKIHEIALTKRAIAIDKDPYFYKLIQQIMNLRYDMSILQLSRCVRLLSNFNVSQEEILFPLITTFEDKMKTAAIDDVQTVSLSAVSLCVSKFENIWSKYTNLQYLPIVLSKLDSCDDYDDLRYITNYLRNAKFCINSSIAIKYAEKCRSLLMEKEEDECAEMNRMKTIVKCTRFLHYVLKIKESNKLRTDLLMSVRGIVKKLEKEDIQNIYTFLFDLEEPHDIINEIKSYIDEEICRGLASDLYDVRALALYYKYNYNQIENNLKKYLPLREKYLNDIDAKEEMNDKVSYIFLEYWKSSNDFMALADRYWNAVFNSIEENANYCDIPIRIHNLCCRYLKFYVRLNYCHLEFESRVPQWIKTILMQHKSMSSRKLCLWNSLLLFFNHGCSDTLQQTYESITNRVEHLRPNDIVYISLPINAVDKRLRKHLEGSHWFTPYHENLKSVLNYRTKCLLEMDDECLSLNRIFKLLKGFYLRGKKEDEDLFQLFIVKFIQTPFDNLGTTKSLILLINFLNSQKHIETEIAEKIVNVVIDRKNIINANPIAKILNHSYIYGYVPKKSDELIEIAGEMIFRDREQLSKHDLVKSAIALCYFNHLPSKLINYIFSFEFLQYFKERILIEDEDLSRNLMELNRAACIFFPNENVTWFHDRYCEQELSKNFPTSTFRENLERALKNLVKDSEALKVSCYSPYYHKIDFVLYTNKNNEPVNPSLCEPEALKKIAIFLHRYPEYPFYKGKGRLEMRNKQLEMLNYKVVVIDANEWRTVGNADTEVKEDYLRKVIWPV